MTWLEADAEVAARALEAEGGAGHRGGELRDAEACSRALQTGEAP